MRTTGRGSDLRFSQTPPAEFVPFALLSRAYFRRIGQLGSRSDDAEASNRAFPARSREMPIAEERDGFGRSARLFQVVSRSSTIRTSSHRKKSSQYGRESG